MEPAAPEAPVMLVTGGSGSIGRVIAAQALAAGWRVALHGRSDASAERAVAGLAGAGLAGAGVTRAGLAAARLTAAEDAVRGFGADMTDPAAIARLVADVARWAGRIDAVVDCATTGPKGARITGLFAETEPEGYGAFLALSIGAVQHLAHAALPWLRRQGGSFIAFASDAGRFAGARQSLIGASRAGIIGFVRNLAVEVARDGVRVHCVSPGFVADTDSARRLAAHNGDRVVKAAKKAGLGLPTPEDIAPLVLFLCGDGARRITGQVISVNGGMNA
ncbi:SDR family oxidoreductase [Sphingobium sufflavum]|uniref:SDR family NAD(P)-dependent oxidoreductase n=1 Tax=Sphingobium sufflavum TaxID=1129547 RepID=UPI001F41AFAC|nr:SDR family oxidoreductase [Sphingobium sufflavum]MCE7795435.1 SDR family oxidoreductase [Sphingobium sufflavum]